MSESSVFRVFPNDPVPPFVDRAEGVYVLTKDGQKILDTSGGGTSYAILAGAIPK
jgi:4-aminobutyrate aminotransferase-like enzyme